MKVYMHQFPPQTPNKQNRHPGIRDKVVQDLESFRNLCRAGLDVLQKGPTVVVLETRGKSNLWVAARKRIDGDDYEKNDESSGVTIILINVMNRHGDDVIGFINVRKIIEDELDGEPTLPEEFWDLVCNQKAMVTGDSLLMHLKRLENSFGRDNGILYTTLHDLTERWRRHKYEIGDIDSFTLNVHEHNGLLLNFHTVFKIETYFNNPYERLSNFTDTNNLRQSQYAYGLNKVFFTMVLVKRILRYFEDSSLSLSVMGTLYPNLAIGQRQDFRYRDGIDQGSLPPKWYEEIKWPSHLEERYGPVSRVEGIRDPDGVRRANEKVEKNCTEGARGMGEKRRLVVSDISDDDDGDRVVIRDRIDDNEIRRHATRAARRLREDQSAENLKEQLRGVSSDPVLYMATIINDLNSNAYRRLILKILDSLHWWPCDRKEMLVSKLAFDGFFFNSPDHTAFSMINRLKVKNPSPTMMLLYRINGVQIADFIALKNSVVHRRSLEFLEEYLMLPRDARLLKLESCDFFVRRHLGNYLIDDEKIEAWIRRICERCHLLPGNVFYRLKRPAFVDELIEHGRQGRMSAENAAQLVVAHTGDDYHDKRDAVLFTVRWPKLARLLHKKWNLYGRAPRIVHCDQNLREDAQCRRSLHVGQKDQEIKHIRSSSDFAQMEAEHGGEQIVIVESRPSKDPRTFAVDPGFILFRSPGGSIYGYFPANLREVDHLQLLDFFSGKTIFTRTVDFIRKYLASHAKDAVWVNGSVIAEEYGRGRTDDAVASLVWGCRFCGITREEWFVDPLTETQEYHAAYGINAVNDLFFHIGWDEALRRAE